MRRSEARKRTSRRPCDFNLFFRLSWVEDTTSKLFMLRCVSSKAMVASRCCHCVCERAKNAFSRWRVAKIPPTGFQRNILKTMEPSTIRTLTGCEQSRCDSAIVFATQCDATLFSGSFGSIYPRTKTGNTIPVTDSNTIAILRSLRGPCFGILCLDSSSALFSCPCQVLL